MEKYLERIMDEVIRNELKSIGGVLIEGPRWCGKTTTCSKIAKSEVHLDDTESQPNLLKGAVLMPSSILDGESPRLIDEWQLAPSLWNSIRREIDKRQDVGLFLLTESAVPLDDPTMHTGLGRIARVKMRTMSLFESLDSNGKISLKDLFDEKPFEQATSNLNVSDLIKIMIRGGWPASIGKDENYCLSVVRNIVDSIIETDISRLGEKKNPRRIRDFLKSYARNISTPASNEKIRRDLLINDGTISIPTIVSYKNSLERLNYIEELPAWVPNLRTKSKVRVSSKRHFVDPSIAINLLGASYDSLTKDWTTTGYLFESLCIRDLRVYTQPLYGTVYHFRDQNKFEIDAIIELNNGKWGAVEIKMGVTEIDEAAKNLLSLKRKITEKMIKPSFLMVLTATKFAYKREDGIIVVPIGCLKN